MPYETTCPYCNALVNWSEPTADGRRISCPRCGETFACRDAVEVREATSAAETPVPAERPALSNRALAGIVLGIMAAMAIAGLILALNTVDVRRTHDKQISKPQVISVPLYIKIVANLWVVGLLVVLAGVWKRRAGAATTGFRWTVGVAAVLLAVSFTVNFVTGPIRKRSTQLPVQPEEIAWRVSVPAKLAAIAYLPADVNVLAGVQVAEAWRDPAAKDALLRLMPAGNSLEKWTGLTWDEIDHLVLGLKIDDRLPPKIILVVHTLKPYAAATVRATLKATRLPGSKSKEVYRFKLEKPAFEVALRFAGKRTLLVALTAQDLDSVPAEPHAGIEHLAGPLQTLLRERLDKSAQVWLAGHGTRWDRTILQPWLLLLPQPDREALDSVHTLALWLRCEKEVVVGVAAESADDASAHALKACLEFWAQKRWPEVKVFQEGAWITGQARGHVDRLLQALKQPPAAQ